MQRDRRYYLLFIVLTIGLGLLSRTHSIPEWIYPYLGDLLYALMFFFIIGLLFPRRSTLSIILISTSYCFLIELSQLYQAEWINSIRRFRLGGLILGYGFLWSDLLSYFAGTVLGGGMEWMAGRLRARALTENPAE